MPVNNPLLICCNQESRDRPGGHYCDQVVLKNAGVDCKWTELNRGHGPASNPVQTRCSSKFRVLLINLLQMFAGRQRGMSRPGSRRDVVLAVGLVQE